MTQLAHNHPQRTVQRATPPPHAALTYLMRSFSLRLLLLLSVLLLVLPPAASHATSAAMPDIRPFTTWAAPDCPAVPDGQPATSAERLVVHHTHDPVATDAYSVPDVLNQICATHQRRGFDTIGYHYLIDPWGRIWAGRGHTDNNPGQQPEGAHNAGFNNTTVGVAFVGDHNRQVPSAAAQDAATDLLTWLATTADIKPHGTVTLTSTGGSTSRYDAGQTAELPAIGAHRDTSHTECPGKHLTALLPRMRERVAERLAQHVADTHEPRRDVEPLGAEPFDAFRRPVEPTPDPAADWLALLTAPLRLLGPAHSMPNLPT